MRFFLILLFVPLVVSANVIDLKVHKLANRAVLSAIGNDDYAVEYLPARRYYPSSINDDNRRDYVVFFSVEGYNHGNNYALYACIILSDKSSYQLSSWFKIGGKFDSVDIDYMEIENKYLKTRRLKYLQDEADDLEFIYFDLKSGKRIEQLK